MDFYTFTYTLGSIELSKDMKSSVKGVLNSLNGKNEVNKKKYVFHFHSLNSLLDMIFYYRLQGV